MAPSTALARDIPGISTMDGAIDTSGGLPRIQLAGGLRRHNLGGHELGLPVGHGFGLGGMEKVRIGLGSADVGLAGGVVAAFVATGVLAGSVDCGATVAT